MKCSLKDIKLLKLSFLGTYKANAINSYIDYKRRISKVFSSRFEIRYDYTKVDKRTTFKQWSGLRINAGLSFNFGTLNWKDIGKAIYPQQY